MSAAVADELRPIHALRGRLRVHVPHLVGGAHPTLESALRAQVGIRGVQANTLTGNLLVRFDPEKTDEAAILASIRASRGDDQPTASRETEVMYRAAAAVEREGSWTSAPTHTHAPRIIATGKAGARRARIAVRGLDSDPAVARHVVDRLERHPGVRARANPLTGRVLIEFNSHETDIRDLVSNIVGVELPDMPGEDVPTDPLDPAPLIQSATRAAGASLGLGLIVARQIAGVQGRAPGSAHIAGALSLVQGFPATRNSLRAIFGRDLSDLLFSGASIVALALSGNPVGLAVTGTEALRLLTEVVARRRAFKAYEDRLGEAADPVPGTTIRLERGDRTPLAAKIIEGTGTSSRRDGHIAYLYPGVTISAGARVQGGPFMMELQASPPFVPEPRPAPIAPSLQDQYQSLLGPLSLAYAVGTAIVTRSLARAFEALLLVNPRPAFIGAEAANTGAAARVLRSGVTVIGTRTKRPIRRPHVLLIDGARVLTDGVELTAAVALDDDSDGAALQGIAAAVAAAAVAAAAGSPWGGAFRAIAGASGTDGSFDGTTARARVNTTEYRLTLLTNGENVRVGDRLHDQEAMLLALYRDEDPDPLMVFALRPRLAAGVAEIVSGCRDHGVAIEIIAHGDRATARAIAHRAGVRLSDSADAIRAIRERQETGGLVALVSDSADSGAAFMKCDLAIGLSSGRSNHFAARADLLSPDLGTLAAIIEAGARRDATARDAVALSAVANLVGAALGWRGGTSMERVSLAVNVATLGTLAEGWARLRGGERSRSSVAHLVDPRPERWSSRSVADVLTAMQTSEQGLSTAQAADRFKPLSSTARRNSLLSAIIDQLRSPLTAILGAGAALSFVLGSPLDVAMIGATIGINVIVGVWQERRAGQATEALERLSAASAHVLRDGDVVILAAARVVTGDILVLGAGDRVAADARVIAASNLEVDEAALTGESLPVPKGPDAGADADRVVLEGSDVTVGTGRAVVVAVGRGTRMGATAAALSIDETEQSPLGARLARMLGQVLPLAAAGGIVVVISGVLRGRPFLPQLAIGTSIAVASVPEGLPLLAGVGQAAVANRLTSRRVLVRRLGAVEALGRVDVTCTDKTGTLTEGRLALTQVATMHDDMCLEGPDSRPLSPDLSYLLRAAALASPHPDATDAAAHPTDVAVVTGAERMGLGDDLRRGVRTAEAPFDPVRSFHASVVDNHLYVKGAVEALIGRCTSIREMGVERPLDEAGRHLMLARAEELAGRGLRVLMAADGDISMPVEDPRDLVALGFIGISDPLRPGVPAAIARCHAAGIRILMLTGDSPVTARAIADQAGLLDGGEVLTGADIAELHNGDLDRRLESAAVVARVTPLDKLRIVESLQRHGHTVAMTGDGVNDAPALRLADVGVAMGQGGTEVARQAADVVLADDDFVALVEALVEGRSFWRNIRRALGLLLGGNLGELGLVVGASVLGLASPLLTRQILAVNLITDALPALAVALQRPENRDLAALAREGEAALDKPLRADVLRRGASTAAPALVSYLLALPTGLPQARAVAFASIVTTQLAQTLDAGRAEGGVTRPVLGAVVGSGGLLVASLTVPALRGILQLAMPTPIGWVLIAAGAPAAVGMSHLLVRPNEPENGRIGRPTQSVRGRPSPLLLPAPVGI